MDIIPAVDIMGGKVVRLHRGKADHVKFYEHLGDPISLAKKWQNEGARIIHVIDLDAALGLGSNLDIIDNMIQVVKVPLQVGGGIRSYKLAEKLLNKGVNRIILGSIAFSKPSIIRILERKFGSNRIVIALDNLEGVVMIKGWQVSTKISVEKAVEKFLDLGFNLFLVTSVAHDGTLTGPDYDLLSSLCIPGVQVIAAGGIRSIKDLVGLHRLGVQSTVVGKALYEEDFSLSEALKAIPS